jgi:hypothetical protein
MSEISGGLPQPIFLKLAESQGAAGATDKAGSFIHAEGKLAGEKPGDVLEFSYRQGKTPPIDQRKERFAKAGEHFISALKCTAGACALAVGSYALIAAAPALGLGLSVAAAGLHLYGGLFHGWPAMYHGIKGAMTPKQTASA